MQGTEGPRGETGSIGPAGEKGATGPQGLAGYPGNQGEKGDKGASGRRGRRGAKGTVVSISRNLNFFIEVVPLSKFYFVFFYFELDLMKINFAGNGWHPGRQGRNGTEGKRRE